MNENLFLGTVMIVTSWLSQYSQAYICPTIRIQGMLAADCHGLNLVSVPQNLPTGIDIFDLSTNRLRVLHNSTFAQYTSLKYLYLGDNLLSEVETGTFTPLHYLEVLDLSLNAVQLFPSHFVNLLYLRKLDISHNPLHRGEPPVLHSTSLRHLSLSNTHLSEVPSMKHLPALQNLNLADNKLRSVTALQLAPLCSLAELNVTGNSKLMEGRWCGCNNFQIWIGRRNIQVIGNESLSCIKEDTAQCNGTDTELAQCEEIFSSCQTGIAERTHREYVKRTGTIAGISTGVIIAVVLLGVVYFRFCRLRKVRRPSVNIDNKNKYMIPIERTLLNEDSDEKKKENDTIT